MNWGLNHRCILAVNVLRHRPPTTIDRNYMNKGQMFIKFTHEEDMWAWAEESNEKLISPDAPGSEAFQIRVSKARQDMVSYNRRHQGPTHLRVYGDAPNIPS